MPTPMSVAQSKEDVRYFLISTNRSFNGFNL